MNVILLWLGRAGGVLGALLCLVAVAARLTERYWLGGFQAGSLLVAGIALMVAGCFCLLLALVERSRRI
jgi:hypothetical protein